MKVFCDDEKEIFIGVCSVDLSEIKIIKKVSKAIELDFIPAIDAPDDIVEQDIGFNMDTIIVKARYYNEDFASLSDNGLAIYIIP